MNITALLNTQSPVTVTRGAITFTLQCTLEKVSSQNDEYSKLLKAENEIRLDHGALIGKMVLFMNQDWLTAKLLEDVTEKDGSTRSPNIEEIEERQKKFSKEMEDTGKKLKATDKKLMRARAERIAYLTPAWSLTQPDSDEMCPVTVENIVTYTNENLVEQMVADIEAAVLGPLGRLSDITS